MDLKTNWSTGPSQDLHEAEVGELGSAGAAVGGADGVEVAAGVERTIRFPSSCWIARIHACLLEQHARTQSIMTNLEHRQIGGGYLRCDGF